MRQEDFTIEESAAYERYKIRLDYNWGGKVDEDFIRKYSDRKLRRWYKNLRRILSSDKHLGVALKKIRAEERDHYTSVIEGGAEKQNADINRRYVYEQHRVAIANMESRICIIR
jgi:hypothetical protein